MKDKTVLKGIINGALMVGQFGFMLVTPPLFMALLANRLIKKFGIGSWFMIVCLVIGLMTAASTAIDFFRSNCRKAEKSSKDVPVSFRNHI